MKDYEQRAIEYAERYGIAHFTRKGKTMTYYSYYTFPKETFKSTVNLETMKETRKKLWERKK